MNASWGRYFIRLSFAYDEHILRMMRDHHIFKDSYGPCVILCLQKISFQFYLILKHVWAQTNHEMIVKISTYHSFTHVFFIYANLPHSDI